MNPPKAKLIYIEWDNGTAEVAKGNDAAEIWEWLASCQTMSAVHGAIYQGKRMEAIEPLILVSQKDGFAICGSCGATLETT